MSPVPDFTDLRVLTVLPESSVLAAAQPSGTVGNTPLIVILICLPAGCWCAAQVRDMHALTAELAAARAPASAEQVHAATAELSLQKDQAEHSSRARAASRLRPA